MTEDKTPWSLSWFRAQGFDCDLDTSFDFLKDKLQPSGASSQIDPSSVQKSSSPQDLRLASLEPSIYTDDSSTSNSDEAQLEFIAQALSQLASLTKCTPDTSSLAQETSDKHVTNSVVEASKLLQSIDRSIALASSSPPIPENEPPVPTSYPLISRPALLTDTGSAMYTLPMKRVNLITGELRLLQHKISVAEAELIQSQKALLAIPDTNRYRKQYLLEQHAAISAQLKAFREQWQLIVREQTMQLNELRHNIVYYNIRADSGHRLPRIDLQTK
ncbi:Hypothetical protein GLP15_2522 [Giardia lamblia P15]|uniref:Uncharacterized protein n=1 Tax=Giardia intestinalis (strain P15) TaxID=658858 RepID=E1EXB8_GIAIA|nr:Hypothetical protein GLP15_2522 [Giardia lamblia P15]